ncbi:MAG: polysaccharide biosynthesis C-terminal domain-containing protein [Acidobacteria bacterium]|nr:polysaccharide biosynthesis C-terminal domain-containing protein [Acidobacteriota bacterium]
MAATCRLHDGDRSKALFSTWAGSDFGFNSSAPFYILLFGLFFNILAFVSHSAITAFGRTDVFAKLYWIELGGYAIVATYLVFRFQIIGAALAWSLRVIVDSVVVILICKKVVGVEFRFSDHLFFVVAGLIVLSPPLIFAFFVDNFSYWLIPIGLLSFLVYSTMIWNLFLRHYERTSIRMRLEGWFRMQK